MALPENAFFEDHILTPEDLTPEVMLGYNLVGEREIFASAFAPRSSSGRPSRPTSRGDEESEIFDSVWRD